MYFDGSEKCFFTYPEKVYAILQTPFQEGIIPMAATELSQNILLLLPQFSERQFYRGLPILTLISPKGPVQGQQRISAIKGRKKENKKKNHPKVKPKQANARVDSSLYLYSCNRSCKYQKMFVRLAIGFSKVQYETKIV